MKRERGGGGWEGLKERVRESERERKEKGKKRTARKNVICAVVG